MPVEEGVQMYSANRLTNPSAETGDTTGWDVVDAEAVPGGVEGDYCFRLGPTASMEQEQVIPGQPPDYRVTGFFLPEEDHPEDDSEVYAWLEVIYEYGDGSKDEFRFPCRDDTFGML
jgi:hypothetical protein